jgi:hypothetical protein
VWRVTIHGKGVEVGDGLRRLVEEALRAPLQPYGGRVALAHVRLWVPADGDGPGTCYIRVDLRPSGGVALGETAPDLAKAVRRAAGRVGAAVGRQLAVHGIPGSRASSRAFR